MALSNATRLSDFGSGIGTEGAALKIVNSTKRVGIGTTNPQATLQVGQNIIANDSGLKATGVITATTFDASSGFNIGIQSAGTSVATAITALNFVGSGNTFSVSGSKVDISISGGSGGGASKIYDSTVFAYDNIIAADVTIESPYKVATLFTSPDVDTDIEDGVTVTVDSGCVLNLIDI
tara:strand:+ start:19 stop:555 length:537 start_codon:yes stop_codon:yes gene_type:complete